MNFPTKYIFITSFIVSSLLSSFSFAQKPILGLKLGLAVSHPIIDQNAPEPNAGSSTNGVGILGGIYLDIPVASEIVFRSGAEIVSKGSNRINSYYYPPRFTYLDIPLNVLYRSNSNHGHLITGGGPVLGIPFQPSYGYTVKTDVGINGIIGYEFPIGFSCNINYCYGLLNVSKNKDLATKISTRYLGLSVGYSF